MVPLALMAARVVSIAMVRSALTTPFSTITRTTPQRTWVVSSSGLCMATVLSIAVTTSPLSFSSRRLWIVALPVAT